MAPQRVILMSCGSYNPPTNMHLRMFEIARDHLHKMGTHIVVGGIISPVHDAYDKKDLASSAHRCAMLRLALQNSNWIHLSTWETRQNCWTKTRLSLQYHQNLINSILFDTNELKNQVQIEDMEWIPGDVKNSTDCTPVQIKLLCGADLLESFGTPGLWLEDDIKAIIGQHGLIVVTREGSNPNKFIYDSDILTQYMHNIYIVTEWISNEISSTRIRRALRRGESVRYLMPDSVIDYVYQHGIYEAKTVSTTIETDPQITNLMNNISLTLPEYRKNNVLYCMLLQPLVLDIKSTFLTPSPSDITMESPSPTEIVSIDVPDAAVHHKNLQNVTFASVTALAAVEPSNLPHEKLAATPTIPVTYTAANAVENSNISTKILVYPGQAKQIIATNNGLSQILDEVGLRDIRVTDSNPSPTPIDNGSICSPLVDVSCSNDCQAVKKYPNPNATIGENCKSDRNLQLNDNVNYKTEDSVPLNETIVEAITDGKVCSTCYDSKHVDNSCTVGKCKNIQLEEFVIGDQITAGEFKTSTSVDKITMNENTSCPVMRGSSVSELAENLVDRSKRNVSCKNSLNSDNNKFYINKNIKNDVSETSNIRLIKVAPSNGLNPQLHTVSASNVSSVAENQLHSSNNLILTSSSTEQLENVCPKKDYCYMSIPKKTDVDVKKNISWTSFQSLTGKRDDQPQFVPYKLCNTVESTTHEIDGKYLKSVVNSRKSPRKIKGGRIYVVDTDDIESENKNEDLAQEGKRPPLRRTVTKKREKVSWTRGSMKGTHDRGLQIVSQFDSQQRISLKGSLDSVIDGSNERKNNLDKQYSRDTENFRTRKTKSCESIKKNLERKYQYLEEETYEENAGLSTYLQNNTDGTIVIFKQSHGEKMLESGVECAELCSICLSSINDLNEISGRSSSNQDIFHTFPYACNSRADEDSTECYICSSWNLQRSTEIPDLDPKMLKLTADSPKLEVCESCEICDKASLRSDDRSSSCDFVVGSEEQNDHFQQWNEIFAINSFVTDDKVCFQSDNYHSQTGSNSENWETRSCAANKIKSVNNGNLKSLTECTTTQKAETDYILSKDEIKMMPRELKKGNRKSLPFFRKKLDDITCAKITPRDKRRYFSVDNLRSNNFIVKNSEKFIDDNDTKLVGSAENLRIGKQSIRSKSMPRMADKVNIDHTSMDNVSSLIDKVTEPNQVSSYKDGLLNTTRDTDTVKMILTKRGIKVISEKETAL